MTTGSTRLVEIYLPVIINGHRTSYLISDGGNCIHAKTRKPVKHVLNKNNHYRLNLYVNGRNRTVYVSRLMALTFLVLPFGDDPSIFEVHHIDKNPQNDDISNLMWVTKDEHRKLHKGDAKNYKRSRGETHPLNAIPDKVVEDILRDASILNIGPTELAAKYNISVNTVCAFIRGKTRRYLYDKYDMSDYNPRKDLAYKYGSAKRKRVRELYAEGYSTREISRMLDLPMKEKSFSFIRRVRK